ncbi:MAG: hypothetical protein HFI38_07190 [Lachnospiraceae bacterium]|nr:hypothetical protein [Lachnospiraceae bacterium]
MLVLYDHSPVESCQALCQGIQERIFDGSCHIVDLLGENENPGTPEIFWQKDGIWRTRQYIGLFEYQGRQVTITSRFDRTNPQPFFLWYLIENYLGEAVISLEDIGSTLQENFFDKFLALRLTVTLQQAWKKGGLRAYQSFCRNDSKLSGVIDVARHIRENLDLDNGRMAYRTQSYSLNNHWNVLFLQADASARRRFPDLMRRLERRLPEYSAALRTLAQAAPGWEDARLSRILDHTKKNIINPIYRDWEPVRHAARALLRRVGVSPARSGDFAATGVFLDIDRLWERLLEDKLFCEAKKPFTQQSRFVLNGHMQMRPDFYFPSRHTVLDAKNRPAWERTLPASGQPVRTDGPGRLKKGSPEGKWSDLLLSPDDVRDNVYQVLSYMLALGCSQGGVIFPSRTSHEPVCDPVGPPGLDFWRIPVRIPQAEQYRHFQDLLEKEFLHLRSRAPVRQIVT